MDEAVCTWDNHFIRRSRHETVPGRPNVLYMLPEMHGTRDFICEVRQQDAIQCKQTCRFRGATPCEDNDIYQLCLALMNENGLTLPRDAYSAVDLYLVLRREIIDMIWTYPTDTRRNNNVLTTSERCHRRRFDVMKTSSPRHYCVICM